MRIWSRQYALRGTERGFLNSLCVYFLYDKSEPRNLLLKVQTTNGELSGNYSFSLSYFLSFFASFPFEKKNHADIDLYESETAGEECHVRVLQEECRVKKGGKEEKRKPIIKVFGCGRKKERKKVFPLRG